MANKTNKSSNSNITKLDKTASNSKDIRVQLGEPVSPRIMAQDAEPVSLKILQAAQDKQQNNQHMQHINGAGINTNQNNLLSIINNIRNGFSIFNKNK